MSKAIIQIIIDSSDLENTEHHLNKKWLNYSVEIVEEYNITDSEILDIIYNLFDENKLLSKDRFRINVEERQLFCYFAYTFTTLPYQTIGWKCRKINHATVMFGIKQINNLIKYNVDISNRILATEQFLKGKNIIKRR